MAWTLKHKIKYKRNKNILWRKYKSNCWEKNELKKSYMKLAVSNGRNQGIKDWKNQRIKEYMIEGIKD